jgi:phage pi2 protein 07
MIYVTDNFSAQMFNQHCYTVDTQNIKKSKFLKNTKDAISSISSWRIAKLLHKPVKKEIIKLKKGDIIYVITSRFGRNKSDYKKENKFRYTEFIIS